MPKKTPKKKVRDRSNLANVGVLVPKEFKAEIDTVVPSGNLTQIVESLLRAYMEAVDEHGKLMTALTIVGGIKLIPDEEKLTKKK